MGDEGHDSWLADVVGVILIAMSAAGYVLVGLNQWIALIILSLALFIMFPSSVKDYINTLGDKLPGIGIFKK